MTEAPSILDTLLAWRRLTTDLARFIFAGRSLRDLETVELSPGWVRQLTIVRMLGFRRRVGVSWPYRSRISRLVATLNRMVPAGVVYRGLILPLCAAKLAGMARRNVVRFGKNLEKQTGLSRLYQFADVLSLCLRHPGTFPTEYYVFGMHLAEVQRRVPQLTDGYQIEVVANLVRPPRDIHYSSGFVSAELDVLNDKERFPKLCDLAGVPVVKSLALFSRGEVEWTGQPELPKQDLFLKPRGGGEGRGAARVFYDAQNQTYRIDPPLVLFTSFPYPTEPMAAEALISWLREASQELPFVIQPRLKAHPQLIDLVGPTTLPTLRLVTMSDRKGTSRLLYAYLRFALADVSVDNGAAGGASAMINPETGEVGTPATFLGGVEHVHPLTGKTIKGFTVPFAHSAFECGLQVHRTLAASQDVPVPVIGWDVGVIESGPIFIEGNPLCAVSTAEKLLKQGSWSVDTFRDSLLSHLTPLAGRRISIDPGLDRR